MRAAQLEEFVVADGQHDAIVEAWHLYCVSGEMTRMKAGCMLETVASVGARVHGKDFGEAHASIDRNAS
ncbi:hypothetical protein [Pseudazoarcus pumilus]|uniref:hypothetical protein n=1 Tax=Pseudazoarcus pumilus TaxID=2067960 RepID=UPI000F4F6F5E|nr:hypothetical protein [Pseudazoarcus pumilus]